MREGRASAEAAEKALVRKPQIGDTMPIPTSPPPGPARVAGDRPAANGAKPAGEKRRRKRGSGSGGDATGPAPRRRAVSPSRTSAARTARRRAAGAEGGARAGRTTVGSTTTRSNSRRGRERNGKPVGRYLMCVQVATGLDPGRRARGAQSHRALRQPAGRRRQPDPRQHLPRSGPERAAGHGGGVRRHRHAEERRALPRRRAVRRRGHRREGRRKPAHRADAQGQAADHLPGHQEPDRRTRAPGSPRRCRCPAASWCSSPTRRPTASPSGCPTTSASACARSSTG